MVAAKARAWASSYRALLDDEGAARQAGCQPVVEHPNTDDRFIASCLRVLDKRAGSARDFGEAFRAALTKIWVTTVSSGYCSTDARPVGDQTAILVDRGLIRAVDAAAALIGQHYEEPEFSSEACTDEQRAAFARAHTTFLGQYFLYGRAAEALDVRSRDLRVDRLVAGEALTFVLAHEIGHVIAGHSPSGESLSWLKPENVPAGLHAFAAEIEADALGLQLHSGDMWDQTVGRSEVEARLFAIRSVLLTFETVEACALVPVNRRHLPARRRWEGMLNALTRRFDMATLTRHEALWDVMSPHLRFTETQALESPRTAISEALRDAGWQAPARSGLAVDSEVNRTREARETREESEISETWKRWDDLEAAVWQYRLPRQVVETLVGYEAGLLLNPAHQMGSESHRIGRLAVTELIEHLPRWLRASESSLGSASSGDLIVHLRRRNSWPEPFRSATKGVLPIHTMASAVRQVLARPEYQ